MAIVSVFETYPRETDDTSEDVVYIRNFIVTSDSPEDEDTVRTATGLPQIGDEHPDNPAAIVRDRNCLQDESAWIQWRVKVEYTTEDGGSGELGIPPLDRDPELSVVSETGQKVVERALLLNETDGYPEEDESGRKWYPRGPLDPPVSDTRLVTPRNSAGDPFTNPPVMMDDDQFVLQYVRNESSNLLLSDLEYYNNTLNNATWNGFARHTVKCKIAGAAFLNETVNGVAYTYWQITYAFKINRNTWSAIVTDSGSRGLKETDPVEYWVFTDDSGQPNTELLDGEGLPYTDLPVFRAYQIYEERDFTQLNIEL